MTTEEFFRDDEFEDEDLTEGPDDYTVTKEDFANLFIVPSDWTISTIRAQIRTDFDLNPEFQRRGVWSTSKKSKFIESLILGIPIPQILLTESLDDGRYIVLDGKQRLSAIREFFDGRIEDGRPFRLSGLQNREDLNGKTWNDIEKITDLRRALESATIRTLVLKGWKKQGVLYEIFYRLNSGSVSLSPMELRMSLYRGPFLAYIVRWTEKISELHALLNIRSADRRMKDVELTVRHLAFKLSETPYSGNLKAFLDSFCVQENGDFLKDDIDLHLEQMTEAIAVARSIFGPRRTCRRWLPRQKAFDTRFNRAIFDFLIGSLVYPDFRAWASENKEAVITAFQEVFSVPGFPASVETTTKSVKSTRLRFGTWFNKVREISGIELPFPLIVEEKQIDQQDQ